MDTWDVAFSAASGEAQLTVFTNYSEAQSLTKTDGR